MRRNFSYYCLLAPRIYIFVLRAHPVRDESHNQRNTTEEVATTSPPVYNEPHRSHVLCVKTELGTTSASWSQHHFVAIGEDATAVRQVPREYFSTFFSNMSRAGLAINPLLSEGSH